MEKYRVFVQDVGDYGYSAFDEVTARTMLAAWNAVARLHPEIGLTFIVLPDSRRDIWPDSGTGELSAEACFFVNSLGQV